MRILAVIVLTMLISGCAARAARIETVPSVNKEVYDSGLYTDSKQ